MKRILLRSHVNQIFQRYKPASNIYHSYMLS